MEREYENSFNIRKAGYQKGESKEYFNKLYHSIIREFQVRGFSEYMDYLYDNRPDRLDIIEYSVVYGVHLYYRSGTVLNVEDSNYVPNYNSFRAVMWEECRSSNSSYISINAKKFANVVASVIREGRKEHLTYIDNLIREKRHENNINRTESEEIIENARAEAERIIRTATLTANEETKAHREAAYGEISVIRENGRIAAEKIIEEARKEADEIKRNVREEIAEIKRAAREEISEMRKNAEVEVNELRQEIQKNSADKANKLINRNIAQYQNESRRNLNYELSRFNEAGIQTTENIEKLHSEMCAVTNGLQAEWVTSLDRTFTQLSELKTDFYKRLHEWQVALYPAKYQAIAERYTELYRILNLDKMIREEILFQNQKIETEDEIVPAPETVRALQKLNNTLSIFLKKFEQSLSGLGLYVYYPEMGEEFNEILHVCMDENFEEEMDESELVVEQCFVPGIKKKNQEEFEDDVVIPATVTVKRADS